MSGRGNVHRGSIHPGSVRRGSVWSGNCPSGKCASGEVSGRGYVRRGFARRGSVRRRWVRRRNVCRGTVRTPLNVLLTELFCCYFAVIWRWDCNFPEVADNFSILWKHEIKHYTILLMIPLTRNWNQPNQLEKNKMKSQLLYVYMCTWLCMCFVLVLNLFILFLSSGDISEDLCSESKIDKADFADCILFKPFIL